MLERLNGWKKIIAGIIGVIVAFLGEAIGLDAAAIQAVNTVIIGYLVSQGISDHGKEAAKVTASKK